MSVREKTKTMSFSLEKVHPQTIQELIESLEKGRLPYPPRLTKYEIARIVAARAKQLAMGAKPMIDTSNIGTYDPIIIALEELKQGKLPFVVVRTLPSGKRVEIRVPELQRLEREFNFATEY